MKTALKPPNLQDVTIKHSLASQKVLLQVFDRLHANHWYKAPIRVGKTYPMCSELYPRPRFQLSQVKNLIMIYPSTCEDSFVPVFSYLSYHNYPHATAHQINTFFGSTYPKTDNKSDKVLFRIPVIHR